MHAYCMSRDDLDFVLDVTKFKTRGAWNEDPMKGVPTALKSAFTRRPPPLSRHPNAYMHIPAFRGHSAARGRSTAHFVQLLLRCYRVQRAIRRCVAQPFAAGGMWHNIFSVQRWRLLRVSDMIADV